MNFRYIAGIQEAIQRPYLLAMHSKISSHAHSSNTKVSSKGKQHHHRARDESTEDVISLLERQIELKRRLSRILNFYELYSETPCVRVEDIPAEVHSLPSQDPTNEESLEMKEVTDATKDNSAKSCNVSSNNKANKTTFPRSNCASYEDRSTKSITSSKCNQFILFRQMIIMP
uniref:Uncharacterized protein n=1 Tax=Parascaris univalens TaxID=6257 RepID=A0A915B992_PARUN